MRIAKLTRLRAALLLIYAAGMETRGPGVLTCRGKRKGKALITNTEARRSDQMIGSLSYNGLVQCRDPPCGDARINWIQNVLGFLPMIDSRS